MIRKIFTLSLIFNVIAIFCGVSQENIQQHETAEAMLLTHHAVAQPLPADYPEKSPLAEGFWLKLSVTNSGVYKISGADLKNAGMNISAVNPKQLKLYGNGGGMIPEDNSLQKYLSLQENAIMVVGEEDGVFNESDYVLFYGESPNVWNYDSINRTFQHQINYYATENFYFIGYNSGNGKRIQTIDNQQLTENYSTNISDYYLFHEEELTNPSNGGKTWYGETFSSTEKSRDFAVNIPQVIDTEEATLRTGLASFYPSTTRFEVLMNGTVIQSVLLKGTTVSKDALSNNTSQYNKSSSRFTPAASFTLRFNYPNNAGANGWLDYYEVIARRQLIFNGGQMAFCDKNSIGAGRITRFSVTNAGAATIWNITDLTNVQKMQHVSGVFKVATEQLQQFIAFDGTSYYAPTIVGQQLCQNLAGVRNIQSVIVAPTEFLDLAETLAAVHRKEGLTTLVVTPQQIYTEFSSGKTDVGAIRDFMRMLHKTAAAGLEPQFLLFYGNGTYDYKNIKGKGGNYIPIWTSNSVITNGKTGPDVEYSTDDFFGFLDDDEGGTSLHLSVGSIIGKMDLGIGRFPARNRTDAEIALQKRLRYSNKDSLNYGSWQNLATMVCDDENLYMSLSEKLVRHIQDYNSTILFDKIYTSAYQEVHAAGGTRYPEAHDYLTYRFNTGSLIVNYIGHGSVYGWAEERVMEVVDAQSYSNYDRLAFVVTATCTFSRIDDPDKVSAGEYLFNNPNGGAIGLFTTTRETNAGSNDELSRYYLHALLRLDSTELSIGGAQRVAKYRYAETIHHQKNTQCFVLLGDPTLFLARAENDAHCTAINHLAVDQAIDTLRALSEVTISGNITNHEGQLLTDFQGIIEAKIFDKETHLETLIPEDNPYQFDLWKNVIYSGSQKVENGNFELSFFVPKDIDYTYGAGKISLFAYDTIQHKTAGGSFDEVIVGGINPNADIDTEAPDMEIYINNHQFVSGGITNENPVLLVELYDLHGINTTGSSVGHDIVAILDEQVGKPIVLNSYYSTREDFRFGTVQYPFYHLSEGEHTLRVKAWDSYNNSIEQEISFRVVSSDETHIEDFYAYPNPLIHSTNFVFEHNQAGETLDITIQIFDISGRLVHQIQQKVNAGGFRTDPIVWDGTANGRVISNGIYFYRVRVRFANGNVEMKYNKLVIAR